MSLTSAGHPFQPPGLPYAVRRGTDMGQDPWLAAQPAGRTLIGLALGRDLDPLDRPFAGST